MTDIRTRFESHVAHQPNGCWLWTGGVQSRRYGQFKIAGRHYQAHRAALIIYRGSEPLPGIVCRHLCNNRLCVNPEHIACGSQHDNVLDAIAAGTFTFGERNGAHKLSLCAVENIRRWYGRGLATQAELARSFCVCQATIRLVVTGRTWHHTQEA